MKGFSRMIWVALYCRWELWVEIALLFQHEHRGVNHKRGIRGTKRIVAKG